jgi:membrane-bound serine protease (ClpP class)
MDLLINPNAAYLLLVTAVMLLLWISYHPDSMWLKITMGLCFLVGGYEFVALKGNPWAFLVLVSSPLPFLLALRQSRPYSLLLLVTIVMLTGGAAFLFMDQDNNRLINSLLMGLVSSFAAFSILIGMGRLGKAQSTIVSDDPDSLVGLIGEVRTDIEPYSPGTGSVFVEGELWRAQSKEFIPAGRTVRILRQDAYILTVKETKDLLKK